MINRASTAALVLAAAATACAALIVSSRVLAQSVALYTDAQAQKGVDPYETSCAMCHGANMEGGQGPTLLGPTFTSHYQTVGDLMQFVVQNMPKSNPGGLSHEDYVDILAYVLLKNGWPSGSQALSYAAASASKVALSPPDPPSGQ